MATEHIDVDSKFLRSWRPTAAYVYLIICMFDFVIAPILTMLLPEYYNLNVQYQQWKPITLDNGGIMHVSFGAILGVYAYGRTKEKLAAMSQSTEI